MRAWRKKFMSILKKIVKKKTEQANTFDNLVNCAFASASDQYNRNTFLRYTSSDEDVGKSCFVHAMDCFGPIWGGITEESEFYVIMSKEYHCDRLKIKDVFKGRNKYGFYNEYSKEIIPCIYDNASNFKYDLAIVEQDGKFGIIGKFGQTIIPIEYEYKEEDYKSYYDKRLAFDMKCPFLILDEVIFVKGESEFRVYTKAGKVLYSFPVEKAVLTQENLIDTFETRMAKKIAQLEYVSKQLRELNKAFKLNERDNPLYQRNLNSLKKMAEQEIYASFGSAYLHRVIEILKILPNSTNEVYQHIFSLEEEKYEEIRHDEIYFDPHPAD